MVTNYVGRKDPQMFCFFSNIRPNLFKSLTILYECLDVVNVLLIHNLFDKNVSLMFNNYLYVLFDSLIKKFFHYLFKLAPNIELINLGKDSLITSLNGTLNIHNTKISLTSAENQLNQQKYVCGEFNVSKLINELTERK
jgi:hypothetical protein